MSFSLWREGRSLVSIEGFEPRLASWDAKTHPAQVRLASYLDDLEARLRPAIGSRDRLSLHLEVDVRDPSRLLRHHDVENYLTPIVSRLGHAHFVHVSGEKRLGGGSRLRITEAEPGIPPAGDWTHAAVEAGAGCEKKAWKAGIRSRLLTACASPIGPGAVEVEITFACGPHRNWVNLWKPAGDAMGPILGGCVESEFNPDDDRVTRIAFHLGASAAMGHDVRLGYWWKLAGEPLSTLASSAGAKDPK